MRLTHAPCVPCMSQCAPTQTPPLVFHLDSPAFMLSPVQCQTKEHGAYSFSDTEILSPFISKPLRGLCSFALMGHVDVPATVQWRLTGSGLPKEDRSLSPSSHTCVLSLFGNPKVSCCSRDWQKSLEKASLDRSPRKQAAPLYYIFHTGAKFTLQTGTNDFREVQERWFSIHASS